MFLLKYILVLAFFLQGDLNASNVYICGPKGAKKYHFSKECRGLSNCEHGIYKTTLAEAKELGLTICGWED